MLFDLDRYVIYIIDPNNGRSRNTLTPERLVDFFKKQKRLNRKPFENFPRKVFENVVQMQLFQTPDFTIEDIQAFYTLL